MNVLSLGRCVLLLLAAVFVASCSSNPDAEKVRHVERGDRYAAESRDTFAVVEYASAIKLDPKFGEARLKLAETYERMKNLRAAYPEYIRAADALPDDRNAQVKATQVLLLGGRFEDAKARASAILKKNPKDVDALLLHANAMAALRDPEGAVAQIEEALKVSPGSREAFINLGAVRFNTGAAKEAEAAFRQAIALDPSAVNAKLALANFLWAAQRVPEAEATLKEAVAIEPRHVLANRMLVVLYLATRRINEAEQPLKILADASQAPAARFQLADFYTAVGRTNDAVSLLTSLASNAATSAEAEVKLAALDYTGGRTADAHKRLDGLLQRLPTYVPALTVKAQWLTIENKLDEALDRARAAVAADAQSVPAQFTLAVVHDRRREVADATKAYTEVLRLNPRVAAAQVQLSRLSLTSGDETTAVRYAEEARRVDPSNIDARMALARSLIGAGNLARADTEVADLLRLEPTAAAVHSLNGMLQEKRNNLAAARSAYERALQLSPGFVEALAGVTFLDLAAKSPDRAIARLQSEVTKHPTNGPLLGLLAQAQSAAGDSAKAEQALRSAVAADPRFAAGYTMLAQLYLKQRRLDEARAEFEGMATRDPSAVGARTMVGMLLDLQGHREEAQKSYEATVNSTPSAPVAANNLACIYAEQGANLDVALQLAVSAKRSLPDDASVDDTIGWVYYKKNLPSLAVGPLQESLRRRPDSAEVLYHLGLTYAKLDDKAKAREALARALKIDPKVGGDEARRVLTAVSR